MSELIQPKILKGFRDFLPDAEIQRALLIENLVKIFRRAGFVPIDTPALEYSEILLRKSNGETEKQVFRFTDNGGRDVALRFDLTVPFARFVAEHYSELYFPFKRYHIAKVWRGEKPQAGRYREFIQCDFDILGADTACSDFEILKLIKNSFSGIGIENIQIHVSSRGIFNRFLQRLSLTEAAEEILRIVDKISKIGKDEVFAQLQGIVSTENADKIIDYISGGKTDAQICPEDFTSTLTHVENLAGGASDDSIRIRQVYEMLKAAGINSYFIFDPAITRGLDYYTGIVYETFLTDLPSIGSVCSGGRFGNLTGLYMKNTVSGVGASIGLDRLLAGLEKLQMQNPVKSFIDVLIFCLNEDQILQAQTVSAYLTERGIAAEVFPEAKKIRSQYDFAEKKGINWGIFLPQQDTCVPLAESGSIAVRLRNLSGRTEEEILLEDAIKKIIPQ